MLREQLPSSRILMIEIPSKAYYNQHSTADRNVYTPLFYWEIRPLKEDEIYVQYFTCRIIHEDFHVVFPLLLLVIVQYYPYMLACI